MTKTAPHRFLRGLALLIGLLPAAGAEAGPAAPSAPVPANWTAYAEAVRQVLPGWLAEDAEPALHLRTYLDEAQIDKAGALQPMPVKLWIEPDGIISRVDFPGFAQGRADAYLRASILGRRLPTPPAGLPMPIRLRLGFSLPPATDLPDRTSP